MFDAVCLSLGLPEPIPEYQFAPPRRWRFDWAWPGKKVALEIEGGVWTGGRHVRGKGFLADMEKYNEAAILGWRVLRCTPAQMASGAILAMVEALVATSLIPWNSTGLKCRPRTGYKRKMPPGITRRHEKEPYGQHIKKA